MDKIAMEFEEALDDLVAEFQQKGLDLMSISSALELKNYAVSEAMNNEVASEEDTASI